MTSIAATHSRYEDSWVAGVSVELDVFDGFLTRGKVAEARANLDAAREELRRTELALQLEAKEAQLDLQEAARAAGGERTGRLTSRRKRADHEGTLQQRTGTADAAARRGNRVDVRPAAARGRGGRLRDRPRAALDKAVGHGWKE
jgi:outer membrane protein TolC